MKYTEAMNLIQTAEEKKLEMARRICQQSSEQHEVLQKPAIRRRRKPGVMIAAAAAAALCIGTVSVGAATGWNYSAFFAQYFSSKSEAAVNYDFTGMGSDLDEVFETDDYKVTLNGYIADEYSVYFYYDILMKNGVTAAEPERTFANLQFKPSNQNGFASTGGFSEVISVGDDGVYHLVAREMIDNGELLAGQTLEVSCDGVHRSNLIFEGDPEDIRLITLNSVHPAELHELETPVSFDRELYYAAVSPISVYLAAQPYEDFNAVSGCLSNSSCFRLAGGDDMIHVTVHFKNGTEVEQEVHIFSDIVRDEKGNILRDVTLLSLTQPIVLDDVDYITVNGTNIPV